MSNLMDGNTVIITILLMLLGTNTTQHIWFVVGQATDLFTWAVHE